MFCRRLVIFVVIPTARVLVISTVSYKCSYNLLEDQQLPFDLWMLLFNLLQPTGYVMHQQFNIQQLYALPTLYLCVLYLSEKKQRLVPLTA